mmetsp:Transcript_17796/g.50562  ORF Transcript_17796/g.50562 Transcript_17796/m.50562 type:complete len:209 (-) Transcript_17796:1451-2077(-)
MLEPSGKAARMEGRTARQYANKPKKEMSTVCSPGKRLKRADRRVDVKTARMRLPASSTGTGAKQLKHSLSILGRLVRPAAGTTISSVPSSPRSIATCRTTLPPPSPPKTPSASAAGTLTVTTSATWLANLSARRRPALAFNLPWIRSVSACGNGCRCSMMVGWGEGVWGGGGLMLACTDTFLARSNERLDATSTAASLGLSTGCVRSC